jgi:hypothetical protein
VSGLSRQIHLPSEMYKAKAPATSAALPCPPVPSFTFTQGVLVGQAERLPSLPPAASTVLLSMTIAERGGSTRC